MKKNILKKCYFAEENQFGREAYLYVGSPRMISKLYNGLSKTIDYIPFYCDTPVFNYGKSVYGLVIDPQEDGWTHWFHVVNSDTVATYIFDDDIMEVATW